MAEQTGSIPIYKRLVMADPEKVVRKAFLDAVAGKSMSVYGGTMKMLHVMTKLLPHEFMLNFI